MKKLIDIANPMTQHNPNVAVGSFDHDPLSPISKIILRDSEADQKLLENYKSIEENALHRLDFQYPVRQTSVARTTNIHYNYKRKIHLFQSLFGMNFDIL